MAMVFGVLFGDIFGLHDLIPPLWLRPMEDPLAVLAVPLLFGACLMLLGQAFDGLQAHWQHRLKPWLRQDGALLLLYASALSGIFWRPAWWIAALTILQFCLGSLWLTAKGQRVLGLAKSMAELTMNLCELVLNTLSFLRVGAFALGHAALSHAVLVLADFTSSGAAWLLVFVLGNLFAIVLEGLLVFVQTTRLMLFEFFLRFLHTAGRPFAPLRQKAGAARQALE